MADNIARTSTKQISIPLVLVCILTVLIIPIPTPLLDILLATSITISLVILFVSLFMDRALEFSSFPALLLVTTLFRLAMNVASTRLILLNGDQGLSAAGRVIEAFGQFVVGGNYVIGIVMFVVISIINLKVITKGSSRIAEVAARFTLDAMPGKQMAIDSDLNTGLIGEEEAKRRRKELAREAEFYGAMDGAAKFVSGDAIAGLLITGINICGGLFIGIVQQGMDWMTAAQTYTILTIGDGLVSQIPSIVISTAAGLIVARAASSGKDLSTEVLGQLYNSNKPLLLAGGVCLLFAAIPGLPFLPFVLIGGLFTGLALLHYRFKGEFAGETDETKSEERESHETSESSLPGSSQDVAKLLDLDTLELELGYELVPLVEGTGDLIERIRSIRRQFALEFGFIVPPIHIRDNIQLKPDQYRVLLRGCEIGSGFLKPRHLLAMDPGIVTTPIDGIQTKEPAFGLDAIWIREEDKERAQLAGYTVVDPSTVIATHLTELIKAHAPELLGRQETQELIDHLAEEYPKVVEELIPNLLTVGQVQQVLKHLLREQISIRDLKTILETLADWAPTVKHPEKLAEYVRRRLSRAITEKYTNEEGVLTLANISPQLEKELNEHVHQTDEGSVLALEPSLAQRLINNLNSIAEKFIEKGLTPVLLASSHLRPALARFVERFAPGFVVLSHNEIAPSARIHSVGLVEV